eukprot:5694727-Amphidinium_carterae.1
MESERRSTHCTRQTTSPGSKNSKPKGEHPLRHSHSFKAVRDETLESTMPGRACYKLTDRVVAVMLAETRCSAEVMAESHCHCTALRHTPCLWQKGAVQERKSYWRSLA